jgi:hypothetical protein
MDLLAPSSIGSQNDWRSTMRGCGTHLWSSDLDGRHRERDDALWWVERRWARGFHVNLEFHALARAKLRVEIRPRIPWVGFRFSS